MGFLKYIFNWSSNAVSTTRTLFVSILPSIQLITNSNTITTASSFSLAEKDIQKLLQHRKMTKTSPFKAYDIHRKRSHTITSPRPAKINSHRLNRQDWAVSKDSTREVRTQTVRRFLLVSIADAAITSTVLCLPLLYQLESKQGTYRDTCDRSPCLHCRCRHRRIHALSNLYPWDGEQS